MVVFWTLLIAIPMTAIALSLVALITDNYGQISYTLANLDQTTTVGGRGWVIEITQRLPEVAGMIVGQLVILVILLFARNTMRTEKSNNK
jgi:hypothetical protein